MQYNRPPFPTDMCPKTPSGCLKLQRPEPIILFPFLYIYTFPLKGITVWLLLVIPKLPTSLLWHLGNSIKANKGYLSTALRHLAVGLITEKDTKWLMGGTKEWLMSQTEGAEQCGISSCYLEGTQFKNRKLFVSGISYLIFSDHVWLG